MEAATVETRATKPAGEVATTIASGSRTKEDPEASVETRVDPHPEASTQVIVREVMIEDVPLRSAPMPEIGSSSRGGLEVLDDDLIDLAFVLLSMESWRRMEK
jgi:hypothetical protein